MINDDLCTYYEWQLFGRQVRLGEKAKEWQNGIAHFHISQTDAKEIKPRKEKPIKGHDWFPSCGKHSFGCRNRR
jgi:hypothetical protein